MGNEPQITLIISAPLPTGKYGPAQMSEISQGVARVLGCEPDEVGFTTTHEKPDADGIFIPAPEEAE